MKRALGLTTLVLLIALTPPRVLGEESAPLRLVQTIPLPGVKGRIDHLAVDIKGQRLFVAALGNNTVEILDLAAGARLRSLSGFHEPQGVAFVAEFNRLFVANGSGGVLDVFDGSSFSPVAQLPFSDDADNLRYDAAAQQLYVGFGSGALGIVDVKSAQRLDDTKLAAHPESFQLEVSRPRMYVNVPDAHQIAVIDRQRRAIIATWRPTEGRANFAMALDEADHRLFVAFRKPAQLVVFDTESGKVTASLNSASDADDMFFDAKRRRVYLSCGEGVLAVFTQQDADHYALAANMPTAPGARTALFVPELDRLYLAVPRRAGQAAEVRAYGIQP